jgi:hypothetical protein
MPVANAFQEGIPEVRQRMLALIDEELECDKDHAFTGNWAGPQRIVGKVEAVLHHGPFVAAVRFENEDVSCLTASSFLLNTTTWLWPDSPRRDDDTPLPSGKKHKASMDRAYRFMVEVLLQCRRFGMGDDMSSRNVVTLDGNGENRRAMENALDDHNIPMENRPTIITLELDANVALASALRFGRRHVRLTSGDFRMQVTQNSVCGIERAILLSGHSVLTNEEKEETVAVYFDFCGSPSKDFARVYECLPNLLVAGVTVAKRQPNRALPCDERRRRATPSLLDFAKTITYNHTKVFCDFYSRRLCPIQPTPPPVKVVRPVAAPRKPRTTSLVRKDAIRLVGKTVGIPLSQWPDSDPGRDFDCVKRVGDRLLFRVCKPCHSKCALRAVLHDGALHEATERFLLTPGQVEDLMVLDDIEQ